jgi:hypothetical protein
VSGLLETIAATLGWKICNCNVFVEGTTDVELLWLSAALYYERHKTVILGDHIAILPAGKGDDGGVEGVNRRLSFARQLADADRGPDGSLRYRFIGLYDNDRAGRRAIQAASAFDRRLQQYSDLFLLNPVMSDGSDANMSLRQRFELDNAQFKGLDWEVEDLLSERIFFDFSKLQSGAILTVQERGGRKHRELTKDGKYRLHKFVKETAVLDDLLEVVKLIRALRSYFRLKIDHIIC